MFNSIKMKKQNRLQVSYNKSIPLEKYQKIFYPKRYMEQRQRANLNNTSLNYKELVERDLYKKKDNRINSIYADELPKNFSYRYKKSSSFEFPSLVDKSTPFNRLYGKINNGLTNNSFMIDKTRNMKILDEVNQEKSNNFNILASTKGRGQNKTFTESINQLSPINKIKIETVNKSLAQGKSEEDKKEWEVERKREIELHNVLKNILDKHIPIITKSRLEINSYKKGFREIHQYNANKDQNEKVKKKRDDYLQRQIQTRKNQYIDQVEQKLKNSSKTPLKRNKRKIMRSTRNDIKSAEQSHNITEFSSTNKIRKVTDNQIYGKIKSALNSYKRPVALNNIDIINRIKDDINVYSVKHKKHTFLLSNPKTTTSGDLKSKGKINAQRMKQLINSINNGSKEIESHMADMHKLTNSMKLHTSFEINSLFHNNQ